VIAKRKRASKGKRQEYSYSPMIWVKEATGRRQVWGGSFRTKAEAKAEERRLLQERDAGGDLVRSKVAVAQVFDQYIAEKRSKVKASTLQRSQELLNLLRPLLGSIQAARLRPADVSRAYGELLGRLSKRTVRHCHWQLHGALDLAVRWGQIPVNAAGRVTPPEPDAFEGKSLSADELSHLLATIRPHPMAALIMTAIDTGAREGELLALRWSEVDLDAAVVRISRSVRRMKGSFIFSEPKTKRSRRTVELSLPALAVLRAHRQRQLEQRLMTGELWEDDDLVFPTDFGGPQDGTAISRAFSKLAREAGLEGLRFHDLRHSSVSLLLKNGESMADVSRRAGHAGIGVTVDTYGHQLGTRKSLAVTMGTILTEAVGDPEAWLANG
jgi:integrase